MIYIYTYIYIYIHIYVYICMYIYSMHKRCSHPHKPARTSACAAVAFAPHATHAAATSP